MGFDWGGMVGGAVSGGSGLVGSLLSYKSAQDANRINQTMTDEQRRWEMEMSNTAHQREVNDLRKAGLNPILSVNSGASTPNVAPARVEPKYKDTNKGPEALTNALNSALLAQSIKTERSKKELNESQTAKQEAEAEIARADADFYSTPYGRFVNSAQKTLSVLSGAVGIGAGGVGLFNNLRRANESKVAVPQIGFGGRKKFGE